MSQCPVFSPNLSRHTPVFPFSIQNSHTRAVGTAALQHLHHRSCSLFVHSSLRWPFTYRLRVAVTVTSWADEVAAQRSVTAMELVCCTTGTVI